MGFFFFFFGNVTILPVTRDCDVPTADMNVDFSSLPKLYPKTRVFSFSF